MPNVGAEFTASIVIDKNDLITQALKQLSTAQRELEKNKLEIYFDLSNADLSKKLKEYQKQLSSTDYTIKINNNGIEETYKSLDKLLDIVKTIASGKDFGTGFGNINTDTAIKQIDKLENRISELTKKYEELQKKSSSTSGNISGKDVNLVDNEEFKKLSVNFEKIKGEVDDLKTHMNLLSDSTVGGDSFLKLGSQVDGLSAKLDDLLGKYVELANVQDKLGGNKTNISNQLKDAFQTDNSNTVQKQIQANNNLATANGNVQKTVEGATSAIKENAQVIDNGEIPSIDALIKKANEAAYALTKGKDIVSQTGKRQVYKTTEKTDDGKTYEGVAGSFSYVERTQAGQLKSIQATFDETTQKWREETTSLVTYFNQVEKAIISADNKINSLENDRAKTLAAHPGYDTSADDALIESEKNRRAELQKTLDLYATEKEYVYQIEAANKRIAENQQRLANVSAKKENLRDTISDEKAQLEIDKQLAKEQENLAKVQLKQSQAFLKEQTNYDNEQKKAEFIKKQTAAYDELTNTISKYSEVAKRVSSGKAEDGDLELMTKLEDKISQLQKQPILSDSQVAKSEKMLVSLYDQLDKIERKLVETNRANQANAVQNKWDKNVEAIQKYMDAVSELNRRKTVDKGTGKDAEYIAAQEKEVERLKVVAEEARATLSSMVNPHNVDINTWDKWVSVMEQFSKASQGSADSVARLKDALRNVNEAQNKYISSTLSKHEGYFKNYQSLIDNKDYLPTNNFREKVAQYESELQSLRTAANELKSQEFISKEQLQSFEGMVQSCQNARKALQGMNASDKGAWAVDVQKEIDKINSDLMKNTKYSAEAKQKLREFLEVLKSGNISETTLRKIHEEFLKITNAEKLAGRAGSSFFDIFKNKAVYGFIGQMQSYLSMYVGFYGMVNGAKNAASTIVQLDNALVDLKKTTAMNSSELENFYYDANDVAKQMGVTTEEIITQASAWSRLSYSSKEASTEMAKLSSQFASISPGMDTTTAQEDLVSIMRAYDIDPDDVKSQIMDKINVLGRQFIAQTYSNVWHTICMWHLGKSVKYLWES